jgi:hypothetical protein
MNRRKAHKESAKAQDLPRKVWRRKKKRESALSRTHDAQKEKNAARTSMNPEHMAARDHELSRHLHRSYFPKGPEGDHHHLSALTGLHGFNPLRHGSDREVAGEPEGTIRTTGWNMQSGRELRSSLRHHGYHKIYKITSSGQPSIFRDRSRTPIITMRPESKS